MKLSLDHLRHLFAIFVILQHMTSARYSQEVNYELGIYINYVDGAVAGFFLLSGYFSKRHERIIEFIKCQTVRLLAPYLVFSLTYACMLSALGRGSLSEGMFKTVTFHGAGMQLYFLPYLLCISVVFAAMRRCLSEKLWSIMCGVIAISLMFLCVEYPTPSSTGSALKLLPFYFLAYTAGYLYRRIGSNSYPICFIISSLFLGLYDQRFYDLSGVMLLFFIVESISKNHAANRIPGSGGVYLMHTPIVNFAISIVITKLGVVQLPNAFVSVALTYVVCMILTLGFIKFFPKYRWILLE